MARIEEACKSSVSFDLRDAKSWSVSKFSVNSFFTLSLNFRFSFDEISIAVVSAVNTETSQILNHSIHKSKLLLA